MISTCKARQDIELIVNFGGCIDTVQMEVKGTVQKLMSYDDSWAMAERIIYYYIMKPFGAVVGLSSSEHPQLK